MSNRIIPYEEAEMDDHKTDEDPLNRPDSQMDSHRIFIDEEVNVKKITVNQYEWLGNFQYPQLKDDDEEIDYKVNYIYIGIVLLRRITRVLLLMFALLVLVIIFIVGHVLSMKQGEWESTNNITNLEFKQGNCITNVYNHNESTIKVIYDLRGSMISSIYQKEYGMNDYFTFKQDGTTVQLFFINYYENIHQCTIQLYLPLELDTISFKCFPGTQCYIVSHENIKTQIAEFTTDAFSSLFVNFKTLVTNTLNYTSAGGGAVYFNHLLAQNAYIQSLTGPILVQSTEDFEVNFQSNISAFCSSSVYISGTSANCNSSKIGNCTGSIKSCQSSNCNSNLQSFQITTTYGTIYTNLINMIGQNASSVQIFQSDIFDQATNFDLDSLEKIKKIKSEAFVDADLSIRVDVGGNYLLQSLQSTYWAYFSNRAYAAFHPWWLSTLSAGFLTAQTYSIDLNLQPGFCPYHTILTIEQIYKIEQLILNAFTRSVGSESVILIVKENRLNPSYSPNYTNTGVDTLIDKTAYQSENWYEIIKKQQTLILQPLEYDPFFIAAIVISVSSAFVFAFVLNRFMINLVTNLEQSIQSMAVQLQNYSNSQQNAKVNLELQNIAKTLLVKLNSHKGPPLFYSILSYYIYLYRQTNSMNTERIFLRTLFKQPPKRKALKGIHRFNYEGEQKMDDKKLKEIYEKFCHLTHLTIKPLTEQNRLLSYYGFEINELEGNLGLAKLRIKEKPEKKTYSQLSKQEREGSYLDCFLQTQFDFTGIGTDVVSQQQLNSMYHSFLDEGIKHEKIDMVDVSEKYNLMLTNIKSSQLQKSKLQSPYFINQNYNIILEAIQNPKAVIRSELIDSNIYTMLYCLKQSIIYCYRQNARNHYYNHYDILDEKGTLTSLFNIIYMPGWFMTEVWITASYFFVIIITLLPNLYFLILINTAYSKYALYTPQSLLYPEDILIRPWSFYQYIPYLDPYVTVFILIIIIQAFIAYVLEIFKDFFICFPEDIGFLYEFQRYQIRFLKILNNMQWFQFIFDFFFVCLYLGTVMVWLILGAIINPNNFLVYASSAATLTVTIFQQIQQAKLTFEFGKNIVMQHIRKDYIQTATLVASSLLQESLKLSDQTIQIPQLTNSFQFADKIGFGKEIREICFQNVNFFEMDQPGLQSIDLSKQNYNLLKDKLFDKISNKSTKKLIEQFQFDKELSQTLISLNFKKFEEVQDKLAEVIERLSMGKLPAFLIKWVLNATEQTLQSSNFQSQQSGLLQDLLVKLIMRYDQNENAEQVLMISIKYLYLFITNPKERLGQVNNLVKDVEFIAKNENNNDELSILKYCLDFLQLIILQPADKVNQQNEIINNIAQLVKIDELITFILSFIFSTDQQQTYRLGNKVLNEPKMIEQNILNFIEKYQTEENKNPQLKILIHVAIRFLKVNRLQIDKIFKFLDKDKVLFPNVDKLSYYYSTFLHNVLMLSSRNWQITFERKLNLSESNKSLIIDLLFINSKYLWSQRYLNHLDKQRKLNKLNYKKAQDSDDEDSDEDSQQLSSSDSSEVDFVEEFNEIQLEFNDSDFMQCQPRYEKLQSRKLVQLISKPIGFTIDQTVGCIIFLKGECEQLNRYHLSFYQFLFLDLMQVKKFDYEKMVDLFDLLTCTNFEQITYKMKKFSEEAWNEFNSVFLTPEDQFTYWIFHPGFLDRERLASYLKSGNEQLRIENGINYYKSAKCTFYGYLQSEYENERLKKTVKKEFYDYLLNQFKCRSQIATLFLDLQNSFLQDNLDVNQINLSCLNGANIRSEAFLRLLYLQDFNRPKHMADAVQYFLNQNQDENYKDFKQDVIAESLTFFINIENIVNELEIEMPDQIPFYFQHLRFLFLNRILDSKIPISDTSIQYWVKYGLKFLISENLINDNQLIDSCLNWMQLFFTYPITKDIHPILAITDQYTGPFQIMLNSQIKRFFKNSTKKSYYRNLFVYLNQFFNNQKLLNLQLQFIDGLASEHESYTTSTRWIGNRLKYMLTLDQECFSEFAVEAIKKLVNSSNMDGAPIQVLFTIFSQKPDYLGLNRFFGLKESTIKLCKFISSAMVTSDKQQIISRWQQDKGLNLALKNQLQIDKVEFLFDQLKLLAQEINDLNQIINLLHIGNDVNLAEVYKTLLSWMLRDYHRNNFQTKAALELNAMQIRRDSIKKIQKNNQIYLENSIEFQEVFELYNWFIYPEPVSFLCKLSHNPTLWQALYFDNKEFENNLELITFPLFMASTMAIVKYDCLNKYKNVTVQQLQVQTLRSQLNLGNNLLDILSKSPNDIADSSVILNKLFGIDPNLVLGIIHDDQDNQFLNVCFEKIPIEEQIKHKQVLKYIESKQHLSILNCFQLIYMEYMQKNDDTYKQQIDNEYMKQIIETCGLLNKHTEFAKSYPITVVLFLIALKQIRKALSSHYADVLQRYFYISHYMDIVLTLYDLFLLEEIKIKFNKKILNHILCLGLCNSQQFHKLYPSQSIQFHLQHSLFFPGFEEIKDQIFPQIVNIFDQSNNFWKVFNSLNSTLINYDLQVTDLDMQTYFTLYMQSTYGNDFPIPDKYDFQELKLFYQQKGNQVDQKQIILLAEMLEFPYSTYTKLLSKYPQKTLSYLKQELLPQIVSEVDLELLDNHTTQNYDKLIEYFVGYIQDQGKMEKIDVPPQKHYTFLTQQIDIKGKKDQYKKNNGQKETISLIQLLDQISTVQRDQIQESNFNMILVAFYSPLQFEEYDEDLLKCDDPLVVSTLMKMLIKYNIELQNDKEIAQVPLSYQYFQFEQKPNADERVNEKLKKSSLKLNKGLEKIVDNCQGLNDAQTQGIRLLIRCFLGDIEAWYLLYKMISKRAKQFLKQKHQIQDSDEFLLVFLKMIKLKKIRNIKYSKEQLNKKSFINLLSSIQKDFLEQLLNFMKDNIPTNNQFVKNQKSILQFFQLVLLQKVEFVNDEAFQILKIEDENLKTVLQLILFIIYNDQNQNSLKYFKIIEKKIGDSAIFKGQSEFIWKFIKFIYLIRQSDDLDILIQELIKILEYFPQLKPYEKYLQLIISLNQWFNVKSVHLLIENLEQKNLKAQFTQVLEYPLLWLQEKEHNFEISDFVEIFKFNREEVLRNKVNSEDDSNSLFSNGNHLILFELLPKTMQEMVMKIFDMSNFSESSQEFVKLLWHRNNEQGLGSPIEYEQQKIIKSLVDKIKEEKQETLELLEILIIRMPQILQEPPLDNQQLGDKFSKLLSTFFTTHKDYFQLLIQISLSLGNCNQYDRLVEVLLEVCGVPKMEKITSQEVFQIINQIADIFQELQKIFQASEKKEEFIYQSILGQLKQFKLGGKKLISEKVLKAFDGIYALKYGQFQNLNKEFFGLIKSVSQEEIKDQLVSIHNALQKPLSLIAQKEALFDDKSIATKVQHLGSVSSKLISGKDILFEDMFKLIDQTGSRYITGEQFHNFLKRTGIEITSHKLLEILISIKKDTILDVSNVRLDFQDFQKAFEQIQSQTLDLALDYLGISKELLTKAILVIVLYLLLLIAFILIGIQAFAIPGTFGSIINSLFPALGGLGLSRRSRNHKNQLIDLSRIEEIVTKAIKIIQSIKI